MISLISACVPSESTVNENNGERNYTLEELRQLNQMTTGNTEDQIVLNYKNESSGIQISLDPDQDEFFLDLKGMKPAEKDTVVIADSTLIKNRENDIREVLSKFRKAQDLFYLEEYTEALRLLNETLEVAETADAYALKGTIHFMMGNQNATRENWNLAVQINPDLPIPSIPELETIINDIKLEEGIEPSEEQSPGDATDEDGSEQ
ncbi:tetratricopeptide repeat protein [Gracilimonas tropica]|uniref:tetratricopeptide repeat protein n=1 Tax=Gracilimonas tropica TaxID=454600 RepID=UPI000366CE7E|nr:tetratricopeptide repeat protein [Gracilimonas tropica]